MTASSSDDGLGLAIWTMLEREALVPRNADETTYTFRKNDILKATKALLKRECRLARIDEVERAKNRKQIFGYYDERLEALRDE